MTDHDCYENMVTNCDGDVHMHFCSVCGNFLGETECPEKGTF